MEDGAPVERVDIRQAQYADLFERSANERRILSIIKSAGGLSSAEIARLAELSAQSASVITRALEADGLIQKGEPSRGKVGKPLTPFLLNPSGAFSVGLRIGRRSAEMVLMNFSGEVQGNIRTTYPFPTPPALVDFAAMGLGNLVGSLPPEARSRIVGLGVGMPFEIWNWPELESTPSDELLAWRDFDLAGAFADFTDLPVLVANDSSMACNGEHAFGGGAGQTDFVYLYVGSLVGAGVVLNNRVYLGPKGNAAAYGSLPVLGSDGTWRQLNTQASLIQLEEALRARWPDRASALLQSDDWAGFDDLLEPWFERTADGLAYAALSAVVAFDLPQVVIDCSAPPAIRAELVARVTTAIGKADTRGIDVPSVVQGKFGRYAGALGSAFQPIAQKLLQE
ncbi:ROK family protein [Rhodobacterales bacterium HKCCE4037]|nr:ROK family protein [Rhodobacterales bacterium HKCCE4037]